MSLVASVKIYSSSFPTKILEVYLCSILAQVRGVPGLEDQHVLLSAKG